MEPVLDFIKWTLIALLALVLLWMAIAATKWLPRPTDAQRKALAILDAPRTSATGQHNAFAALWLWHYDVPAADLEKVANDDVARYRIPDLDAQRAFESAASGKYRYYNVHGKEIPAICVPADDDCLAKIRHDPEATRAILMANSALLDHALALSAYDHFHSGFPLNLLQPQPEMSGAPWLQLSDAALHFADGHTNEGVLRACMAARTWRRLALHDDNAAVQASASNMDIASAALFANMLAEIPADAPLPQACAEAFAPIADPELSLCDTMKSQFHSQSAMSHQFQASTGVIDRLLDNADATSAFMAPGYARFCSNDADIQREADRFAKASMLSACGMQGVVFDPLGCGTARIIDPRKNFARYAALMRNLQAMNALIGAALALRAQSPAPFATGHSPAVRIDTQARQLRAPRLYVTEGDTDEFAIPLPASRLAVHGVR